jgi:hypothetical protein
MRKPKARIYQNIWGNWNAYLGTRKHKEFGTDSYGAKQWLLDQLRPKQDYGRPTHPVTGESAPEGTMWCQNAITGVWFLENDRTPYTVSAASETYWST